MLTNKYWEDRYRAEEKARELADKRVAYQLNGVYQQHANNIQKEIDSFWQRYADKEGITKLEAKQRADRLDMVNVEFKARQLVERANRLRQRDQKVTSEDFTKAENDLMRLYNLKMKTSRLEVLQANIKLHQYDLALSEFEIIDKHLTESIRRENLFSAGVLNMTLGSFEASKVSADTIIYANFNNATWSSRIWERQSELRDIVKKGVADTVLRGKGTNILINNLRKEFDISYGYARRLAVTESARVYSEAQKANYEANGVEEFEIMTELKACQICQPFNGKIFKVSELVPALNAPPFHPNCRCTTVPHFNHKKSNNKEQQEIDKVFEAKNPKEIDDFFRKQKSYQKWYNELTDDERSVIYSYTTENYHNFNNINRYGLDKALKIREKFWLENDGGIEDLPFALDIVKDTAANIPILEKAISKFAPNASFKAYRGSGSVSALGEDLGYLDYEVGQTIRLDKSFTSFSLDKNYAKEFAIDGDGADILFEVTVKKGQKTGAYIADLADFNPEKEYLMKPNLKYNITSKTIDNNGMIIYGLEVLGNGI